MLAKDSLKINSADSARVSLCACGAIHEMFSRPHRSLANLYSGLRKFTYWA